MAGGKESPRQKMIGMMYLVLTALLALQVSSAIIQKFKFLDDSLQVAVTSAQGTNNQTDGRIKKAVKDNGGKAEDLAVLAKAEKVRKLTNEMIAYMNALRTEMIETSGGVEKDEATGAIIGYVGAKEEQKVVEIMVGPEGSKKGKGYELQKKLNGYAQELSNTVGAKTLPYTPLALDAKDDKMFAKDKEQNKKDFAELNFAQTPMVAALAVISTKEAEMLKLESLALEDLARQVGASNLSFDQVFAMSRATSNVVAAGTDYEAEMFIAASSSAIKPSFSFEGREVPGAVVNGMNVGKVKFKASAGNYDKEGNAKKSWKGTITIKNKGKDTSFKMEVPYIVARPVIQVQSASVQALYRNCGNELNVQVPALGSSYNPSFSASGAEVVKGSQKGIVTLIPTAASVKLNVSSGGTALGSQDFKVRLIPKPEIQVLVNGKPVDEKVGMSAPGPRALTVVAKPDESFAAFLPKDARYQVTSWMAVLVRGKRPVSTQNFSSSTGNLSAFASQAQPGDRIMIEVKEVRRTNFLNKSETVNLGTPIKNVPLN
jgi:gliding motility-associated protein GldM